MSEYLTEERKNASNQLWAVTSAVGASLCFVVLVMSSVVWLHPKSRPCLDRVSWRIVVWALAANFLLFSISLNLQFVIIHNFRGQSLEKFYIAASAAMAIILAVPPYAAGVYGWDPLEGDCWYSSNNPNTRIIWQISTQMLWTALTAFGEIITSGAVMIQMLRHNSRMQQTFAITSTSSGINSSIAHNRMDDAKSHIIRSIDYRHIVLRIALYPLASCFVNLLSVFTALHSTVAKGIHNPAVIFCMGAEQLFMQFWLHLILPRSKLFSPSGFHRNVDSKGFNAGHPSPDPVVHIELSEVVHHDFHQDAIIKGKDSDQLSGQVSSSGVQFEDSNIHVSASQNNAVAEHENLDQRVTGSVSRQGKNDRKEVDRRPEDSFWRDI
ncbi:hypothetical protein K435DRAFT_808119 [Dendrothele bispora CBS 962.96]|uniref:G-protein coupled receptors family 2 profile 2 domain-containing protein n=1 Tax=Dendrothele bispora (strain CBS 962.96) TaxID=1314807 RepID=A0A4S8L2U6_DENBC|nr:hypothetical protein K435DRAFT_808119 [Dendrothele bispora CBS 962.96]